MEESILTNTVNTNKGTLTGAFIVYSCKCENETIVIVTCSVVDPSFPLRIY